MTCDSVIIIHQGAVVAEDGTLDDVRPDDATLEEYSAASRRRASCEAEPGNEPQSTRHGGSLATRPGLPLAVLVCRRGQAVRCCSLIRREFTAYFLSPIAYVVLVVFLLVTGLPVLPRRSTCSTDTGPRGIEYPMQAHARRRDASGWSSCSSRRC